LGNHAEEPISSRPAQPYLLPRRLAETTVSTDDAVGEGFSNSFAEVLDFLMRARIDMMRAQNRHVERVFNPNGKYPHCGLREGVEMNPLTWQREHQLALLLGTVLGIFAGLLVGFIHNDVHLATLLQWGVANGHGIRWAAFGALFGAGVIYVQRLLRT
jgi:hypothetical protein